MVHRPREHRVVLLHRQPLFFLTQGSRAILQRHHVVTLLVSRPHGGLDTAIRQEAAQSNVGDPATAQNEIQVGAGETAEAANEDADDENAVDEAQIKALLEAHSASADVPDEAIPDAIAELISLQQYAMIFY